MSSIECVENGSSNEPPSNTSQGNELPRNESPSNLFTNTDGSITIEELKMKKYSKLAVLKSVGFVSMRFNRSTQKFEKSYASLIHSYLIHLVVITTFAKYSLSLAFDENSTAQLFVGSFWSYLNYDSKVYLGVIVSDLLKIE